MSPSPAPATKADCFLIDAVSYEPAADLLKFRFRNGDLTEIRATALWRGRAGRPDWSLVQIEPDTRAAVLVPTGAGQAAPDGATARIPSEVIRTVSGPEPCAAIQEVSAADGGVQGCE